MNEVWVIIEAGVSDDVPERWWSEVNLREGYFESKEAALARCEELIKSVRSEWVESHHYSTVSDIEQLDGAKENPFGYAGYEFSAVPRWFSDGVVERYSASVDRLEKHE